ncbi:MAG TPA: serine/threonine-protein kinase [Kofleriaceae bacterium]|nr:serine/threonine-protein kinase [Kofleriaceae bacterium]
MSSIVGTVLQGRYRVTGELASGGMGTVYRGERLKLGRVVAIKFLHNWTAGSAEARSRFETEARAMGKLHHPNCVTVTDFGVHDEVPYLVMDFVEGRPLTDLLDHGSLEPERAVKIALKILAGLAHAHDSNIVHRDVKPANVMITAVEGFDDEVRLVDFGVAKFTEDQRDLTGAMAIGTPAYMAPEQTLAEPVDARTDLYAVGVVLHFMLTGDKPFDHENNIELLRYHREEPRPPLSGIADPLLSAALERVVHKAMAVAPSDRYQSAAAMAGALRATLADRSGPTRAEPAAEVPSSPRMTAPLAIAARGPGARGATPLPPTPVSPPPVPMTPAPIAPLTGPVTPAVHPERGSARQREPSRRTGITSVGRRRRSVAIGAAVFVLALIAIVAANSGDDDSSANAGGARASDSDPDAAAVVAVGPAATASVDRAVALGRSDNRAGSKQLEELARVFPNDARVRYELGNLYFDRPWWPKGYEAYRAAIERDPAYRKDERLLRNAVRGLSSDSSHRIAADFLRNVVGAPAIPHLRPLAGSSTASRARDRARTLLGQLEAMPPN